MDKICMVHRDSLSCEAIVRKLSDGSLLLLSQCGGLSEPCIDNRVLVFHSNDGEHWSKPELIKEDNGRALYTTDVFVDGDTVTAYMTEHNGEYLDDDCFALVSRDGGYTWERRELPVFRNAFVFLRGTFRTTDGKIIIAYQHYPIPKEENDRLSAEGKSVSDSQIPAVLCGTLVSEDGAHFRKSNDIAVPNEFAGKRIWQWPEPTVAELSHGFAMLLRVNGAGVLYRSDSEDGLTWSAMYPTDIPNPNNKPKLIRMEGGAIALINTPNPVPGMKNRNPLEIWISDDDMRTWRYKKRVLDFPGWLSYPDGFAEGKRILFSFEVNRHDVYFADCDVSDFYG